MDRAKKKKMDARLLFKDFTKRLLLKINKKVLEFGRKYSN